MKHNPNNTYMKFQHLRTIPESDTSPQLLVLVHTIKVCQKQFFFFFCRILVMLNMECKYVRIVRISEDKIWKPVVFRWKQIISLLLVFECSLFFNVC